MRDVWRAMAWQCSNGNATTNRLIYYNIGNIYLEQEGLAARETKELGGQIIMLDYIIEIIM